MQAKRWTVDIYIDEQDGETRADARLHTQDKSHLHGSGTARLNPIDRDVPEIGDELAAARALSMLAHELLTQPQATSKRSLTSPPAST
jgi:hypothetical protein